MAAHVQCCNCQHELETKDVGLKAILPLQARQNSICHEVYPKALTASMACH